MRIFISWSGQKSKLAAEALREWFRLIFQSVDPWMSAVDIKPGAKWAHELSIQLDSTDFGILCLTSDNLSSPWIVFEAGALSKSLEHGSVIPYLIDITPDKLFGPLQFFQALTADREGTKRLVMTISERNPINKRSDAEIGKVFKTWWPELEAKLNNLSETCLTPNEKIKIEGADLLPDERMEVFVDEARSELVAEIIYMLNINRSAKRDNVKIYSDSKTGVLYTHVVTDGDISNSDKSAVIGLCKKTERKFGKPLRVVPFFKSKEEENAGNF